MTRSFRFKLAVRATVAVVVGLSALSAITIVTLKTVLDREIDTSLLNIAAIQAASLADDPSGAMHFHEWELTPEEASSVRDLVQYAQVWGADGASLLRSQYMTEDLPTDLESLAAVGAGELTWMGQDFGGVPVRTLFYPLERLGEAHQAHVLQVAAPLSRRNEMLLRSGLFLGLLTTLLATAAFAGSWWLAGSAVRPIHEVMDQAEEIGASSLDRRIHAYGDTLEYRRLVEVLNTMLTRIQSAFETQRRFTADASHELRSPLTVIRGEIEVALRRARTPEEYREVLESTLEEAIRLSQISEDLLTLARADAGSLPSAPEPVQVDELLAHVIDRLRTRADAKGIVVTVHSLPVKASIDAGAFQQIAWNLLDNALNFTPRDGSVDLTLSATDTDLTLVVDDTGHGLGSGDPEAVFERFSRGDPARSRGANTAGTGLGLAIVRALAEANDGRVQAQRREAGGSRFTVAFATSQAVEARAGNLPARTAQAT